MTRKTPTFPVKPTALLLAAATLLAASTASAASISLAASDASNKSSFGSQTTTNWGAVGALNSAPSSGNDYFVANAFNLRTAPNGGNETFAGDSLTLGNGSSAAALGIKSAVGATITINNLTLNNGEIANAGGGTGGADNGTFTVAGAITLTAATSNRLNTNNSASRSLVVTAPITGAGALSIIGIGTVTLSGSNSYTGSTTINAGKLVTGHVSALGTGDVSVNSATLQIGDGNVNAVTGIGALTLNSSTSVLDLASKAGIISLADGKNFTMSLGTWKLNANSLTTGASVDQISLSGVGTYTLTGGTIDLAGFTNNGVAGTYDIIDGTGSASGLSFINGTAGFNYSIDTAGDLVVAAVPEPSSCVLMGASVLAAGFVRRRKTV